MNELVFVGYMIIDEHTDDYSDWSGYIAYPNPEGANLAWEKPIKMIQYSAYAILKKEVETLRECRELDKRLVERSINDVQIEIGRRALAESDLEYTTKFVEDIANSSGPGAIEARQLLKALSRKQE
jgi:hypothetical protein